LHDGEAVFESAEVGERLGGDLEVDAEVEGDGEGAAGVDDVVAAGQVQLGLAEEVAAAKDAKAGRHLAVAEELASDVGVLGLDAVGGGRGVDGVEEAAVAGAVGVDVDLLEVVV